jgi:hypothetical protein
LAPLGIGIVAEGEGWAMLGKPGKGQFWIGSFGSYPNYYGAFVIDSGGHNIEAVCHQPEESV